MLERFTVLRGAPRELWIILGAKMLAILAYGIMNSTLVLWLSSDLGYSDIEAGDYIAVWSAVMTLCTVAVGALVDAIGVRKALLAGLGICLCARVVMTLATARWAALSLGLLPVAVGEAMLTPVMVAAVRRYTSTAQRSIAFALLYALMNAGFGIANWIFDYVRAGVGERGTVAVLGMELSAYRLLFLLSFLCTAVIALIVWFLLREGVEAGDEGVTIAPAGRGADRPLLERLRDTARNSGRIFSGLWLERAFYKFLAFLSLVVAVRLIVFHMYYTYPKFGLRELGDGAPIGRLWSINAGMIILLVPFVGALTQRVAAYRMVVIGSLISAASVFIMAMPPAWFQPLADGLLGDLIARRWLGIEGAVHPYYVMIALYVALLSLGEALWSPRLYEYTAAVAPKGREASYMAMSYLPFFLAKLAVGMFSGRLLDAYCPAEGPRDSQTLWLIIALMTVTTPLGLCLFRRWISVKEAGRGP
ncbi:MAG TPA: MFS transporter [Planctomycetota bacterium]|nr:MAG: Major Facilitator Superfamily protein [Planctomycetes bacterium ADurb.Bin069]HNR97908.1 MFS transporter [Planctomycetota bacterium]HNU24566.1 MFS transporter [Planctomycetota bacterium]HOE29043.1 MFS transporter [Planctomycetota bacterium]HOE85965.1 MFS transporter [Planctomycetota bacterium]